MAKCQICGKQIGLFSVSKKEINHVTTTLCNECSADVVHIQSSSTPIEHRVEILNSFQDKISHEIVDAKIVPALKSMIEQQPFINCPYCGATVLETEKVCHNCNEVLIPELGEITKRTYPQSMSLSDDSELIEKFQKTSSVSDLIFFDDNNKALLARESRHLSLTTHDFFIFSYDQIADCELLEDNAVVGSVGSAVAGGALFGAAGAIVGSNTGRKGVCMSLAIKLTVRNCEKAAFLINIIDQKLEKSSEWYRECYRHAQEIMSKLSLIISETKSQSEGEKESGGKYVVSVADEIRKFKELMDDGIITKEEFEAKKKQLLNL